jgi:tetratricopeptide (TPR) repeat protein
MRPTVLRYAISAKRVFIIIACIFISLFGLRQIIGLDIFLHLKTGQWIWHNLSIPRVQLYSFMLGQKEWINHQWLFQAFIYPIYYTAGFNGLIIFRYSIICILLCLFFVFIEKTRYTFPVCVLAMNIAWMLAHERFFPIRPEIISMLFTVLFIVLLKRYRGKGTIFLLLPLQLIWVNTHGYFVIGPVLTGIYAITKIIEARYNLPFSWKENGISLPALKKIFILLALLFPACIFNPSLLKGLYYPFNIFIRSFFGEYGPRIFPYIGELRAVSARSIFLTGENALLHFMIGILFLSFLINIKRLSIFDIAVSLMFLLCSITAIRHIGFFAVSAGILAIMNFLKSEYAVMPFKNKWHKPVFRLVAAFGTLALIVNYSVLIPSYAGSLRDRYVYNLKGDDKGYYLGLDEAGLGYPKGAVSFMRANHITGNIFNVFNNGAYLIFYMYPDCRVFIDGRTELYEGPFLLADMRCLSDPKSIEGISQRYNINCVILPCDSDNLIAGMFDYLYKDEKWRLVFFDGHSSVFLKSGSYEDLIKSNEIDLSHFRIVPGEALVPRAAEKRYYPSAFLNTARFFLKINMPSKALESLACADRCLKDFDFYNLKGAALAGTGSMKQALYAFEEAARINPQDPAVFKNIGVLYLSSGQPAVARKYFEAGLRVYARSKDMQACLDNLDKISEGSDIMLGID